MSIPYYSVKILASKMPGRWDAIVGIPRGGLIVAALLGYELGVQRVACHGQDYHRRPDRPPFLGVVYSRFQGIPGERVLLVEDGTQTGTLLENARRWYGHEQIEVVTAALWVSTLSDYRPDVWVSEVDVLPSARELIS